MKARSRYALLLLVLAAGCGPTAPSPAPTSAEPTPLPASPTPSVPVAVTSCQPDPNAVPLGDPCPSAILAVRSAIAGLGLPTTIVVQPGRFYCGVIWPGVGSPPACLGGPAIEPGREMRAWVAFAGSSKVAAVALLRDLAASPAASPGPWLTNVFAFQVPPEGWVLP
jgi:hypothetical protein